MRFEFHPDADAEFDQAVEYYEQCQSGLGIEFAEEVYAAIARIIYYPVFPSGFCALEKLLIIPTAFARDSSGIRGTHTQLSLERWGDSVWN